MDETDYWKSSYLNGENPFKTFYENAVYKSSVGFIRH